MHPTWTAAPRWVRVVVAAVPAGALAAPLVLASGRVPLFRDELATAQFATLPLADLWRATEHVDRVLLPYLFLMKGWTGLAGDSAVSLRATSALAAIGVVAVVAVLGGRLAGLVGGAVAGLVVALAPLSASLAVLARPYAPAALAAVLALLALHLALESGRRGWWVSHAALVTASLLLQPLAVMALPAHVALAATTPSRQRWRPVAAGWLVAGGVAVLVATSASAQQGQVGWIPEIDPSGVVAMVERALSNPVARSAAAACLVGLALVVTRRPAAWWWVGTALLLGPPVALAVVSVLLQPAFVTRYLFLVPAGAALLVGGVAGVLTDLVTGRGPVGREPAHRGAGRRPGAAVLLGAVLVTGLVLPARVEVRPVGGATPHPGWSSDPPSRLAQAVGAVLRPGDLLVVEQRVGWGGYAGDLARAWGDDGFAAALDRRAVAGELTDVTRYVSSTDPPLTTDAPTGGGPRRVVLLSLRGTALDRFLAAAGTECAAGPESGDPRLRDSHLWVLRCASVPDPTSLSTVADDPVR